MLQMSAYCFGLIVLSCLAFLFLPIARGSILLRLIDIPFEHATRYHVWLGNLIFFLVTMHGLCYMIVWMVRGIIPSEVSSHLYLFTDVHMSLQLCILWSACLLDQSMISLLSARPWHRHLFTCNVYTTKHLLG